MVTKCSQVTAGGQKSSVYFYGRRPDARADRWSSGGPAEERHGISLSELLVMALEAARVICGSVMPNSPPHSLR